MIVSVSHIQKAFDTKEVLQDVSFHLEAKEKASLIGINGAGKTTLFQILLGRLSVAFAAASGDGRSDSFPVFARASESFAKGPLFNIVIGILGGRL